MIADSLPILAICGWSGSGKTTLIEQSVARLCAQGLRVAVVKHDVHGLEVDRPGKDSDRFFRAGANIAMCGPGETFQRAHAATGAADHAAVWLDLIRQHDLVLVEGFKHTPLPKIWLLGEQETQPPGDVDGIVVVVPRGVDRLSTVYPLVEHFLQCQWRRTAVYGCVLIGGKSSRTGRPKHLLETDSGMKWIERTISVLTPFCESVAIVGQGQVPSSLASYPRLPDVPDSQGPLAGLLAAMRWAPWASWLVSAWDLPWLDEPSLQWLLASRREGIWATLPRLPDADRVEPFLAHYDFRCRDALESLAFSPRASLQSLARHAKTSVVTIPEELTKAWHDVDAPETEWQRVQALT